MSILGALGGIGRGVSAGIQDLERMEAAKRQKELAEFAKLQQGRQKQEWEQEDAATARLAAVPTKQEGWSGSYSEAAARGMPTRDDEGNTMPGVSQVARSRETVLNEQADAVEKAGGFRNLQRADQIRAQVLGIQDRTLAAEDRGRRIKQEDQIAADRARERERNEYLDKSLRAWGLAQNPATAGAAMQLAAEAYNTHVKDGMQAVYDPKANTVGFAQNGKFLYQPIPATPDVIKDLVGNSLRFGDRSMMQFFAGQDDKQKDRDLKSSEVQGRNDYYAVKNEIDSDELKAKVKAGYFEPRARSAGGGGAGAVRLVEAGEDGTRTAYGRNGEPLFNILPGGLKAPLGVTGEVLKKEKDKAKALGLDARIGDKNGTPILGYIGKDGRPYYTLEEARAASSPKTK